MPRNTCATCKHFEKAPVNECRAHAPMAHMIIVSIVPFPDDAPANLRGGFQVNHNSVATWPPARAEQGCSEHVPALALTH